MAIQKPKKNVKIKKKTKDKSAKNKKALVIAQEIRFTRLLANSDKKVTNKVLKNLRKWLIARSESDYAFTETDFLRLWKGLFYCMWMSDKPLVQEETAEAISQLVHCFKSIDIILLYTRSVLKSLSSQWYGIDKYRVDKFEMLLRSIVRQTFVAIKNHSWDLECVRGFAKMLEKMLLSKDASLGLILQIIEVYMEELAKISCGEISENIVTELVQPFVLYMISRSEDREIKPVMENIFRYLILQSNVGLDYQEKFNAWRAAGFPCKSIKDIQKIEISDEDSSDFDDDNVSNDKILESNLKNKLVHLDPRAGKVDVHLPQIPFDATQIVKLLMQYKIHKLSTTKARKRLITLTEEFKKLSTGEMPLGIKEINILKRQKLNPLTRQAASRLLEFESDLYSDSLKKRKRKRKNAEKIYFDETNLNKLSDEECVNEGNKLNSKNQNKEKNNTNFINKKKKLIGKKTKTITKNDMTEKNCKRSSDFDSTKNKKKIKGEKRRTSSSSFSVEDIESKTEIEVDEDTSKYSTTNGWNVSDHKPTPPLKPVVLTKSLTPVIEKLDPGYTDFIKEIIKKNAAIEMSKKLAKSTIKTPLKSSIQCAKNKSLKSNKNCSTKVLNPMAMKAKSETKKRVKIVLQRNTAQHTSEYLKQLKRSPAMPFDANRKPLTSVLKASPIPSPINPFYKRISL